MRLSDHRNSRKFARSFRDRFAKRVPLSANRQAVTRIFDVTTGEDPTVAAFDHRSDFET